MFLDFWKMHGLGNDYIVIDNRDGIIKEQNLKRIAQKICKRRFSVGADGLLLVYYSKIADIRMRILNSDGSEAEMCGNGIRCFAKYCYEKEIMRKKELDIETLAGIRKTRVFVKNQEVISATVDMGRPIFERKNIPVIGDGRCINEVLTIDGESFLVTCLSVGNPHCVIFVENVDIFPVKVVGPRIEMNRMFPKKTNVEFVQVKQTNELKVRVWERGVGETLACGTGACAAFAAGNLLGKINPICEVNLPGGRLMISYEDDRILMKGSVEKSFEGKINLG